MDAAADQEQRVMSFAWTEIAKKEYFQLSEEQKSRLRQAAQQAFRAIQVCWLRKIKERIELDDELTYAKVLDQMPFDLGVTEPMVSSWLNNYQCESVYFTALVQLPIFHQLRPTKTEAAYHQRSTVVAWIKKEVFGERYKRNAVPLQEIAFLGAVHLLPTTGQDAIEKAFRDGLPSSKSKAAGQIRTLGQAIDVMDEIGPSYRLAALGNL